MNKERCSLTNGTFSIAPALEVEQKRNSTKLLSEKLNWKNPWLNISTLGEPWSIVWRL
jgi:hypothetical protein